MARAARKPVEVMAEAHAELEAVSVSRPAGMMEEAVHGLWIGKTEAQSTLAIKTHEDGISVQATGAIATTGPAAFLTLNEAEFFAEMLRRAIERLRV